MSLRHVVTLLFAALTTSAVVGQQPATPPAVPELPPRGDLSVEEAIAQEILSGIKAPDAFRVSVFAAPPQVNYPTCVTASLAGELFVCVDRNGSLQTDEGMGTILRLVDRDADGRADSYTVFAKADSPRGVAYDGQTLYVMHPPTLTAFRDLDGDGIADTSKVLVDGLGFGLDFRGADHTTNNITIGIDGWLYIAVGDYGFTKAIAADGTELQFRGGGNVRIRPDGSELEVYATGTRNDYDVAVDPFLNLFARGNNNDGGGWDVRLNHFVAGASYGYPALFRNFADEVAPPLADYGAGSGTGALYVQDARLPAPFGDTLYTADWGTNTIYRHTLTPRGATFEAGQDVFATLPRPTDLTIDGRGHLYLASWRGGQFRYGGELVGYVVQLTPRAGAPAPAAPDLATADDQQLVRLLTSGVHLQRLHAQHALVRRGPSLSRTSQLVSVIEGNGPLAARVAALFTLKQLDAADSHPVLLRAVADGALRPFALRALADRRGELAGVPTAPFIQALGDPDPKVQLQGLTGLRRLGAVDQAAAMLPLASSDDPLLSNVAVNALVNLGATDAALSALRSGPASLSRGALRVLQRLHQTPAVTGLIQLLAEATMPDARAGILQALARLSHREGIWTGAFWSTRPDTTGPYFDPVGWHETARILPVLKQALRQASSAPGALPLARVLQDYERNRIVPPGSGTLLQALIDARDPDSAAIVNALVGTIRLEPGAVAPLASLADRAPAYRGAVARVIAAAPDLTDDGGRLLLRIATDSGTDAASRAVALERLATDSSPAGVQRAIEAFAPIAIGPTTDPALDRAWRQFVGLTSHATHVDLFRQLTSAAEADRQVLGYAVLLNLAAEPAGRAGGRAGGGGAGGRGGGGGGRGGRGALQAAALAAARTTARQAIDAAAGHDSLQRALTIAGGSRPSDSSGAAASAATVSAVPVAELATRVPAGGDVAAGQVLFTRQGCVACHTVSAQEPPKGPFLGGIATRYSRGELIDSIVRPGAVVAQGFATNAIATVDGAQHVGFVVREGSTDVVVRDLTGSETTIPKARIASRTVVEGSVMPPGLVDTLTLEEMSSLLAYLGSLSAN